MNESKVQPLIGVVAVSTDIWINAKNTYLVRNMKNPSPLESNKWPSRNHVLEVLAGFSGDGKGKSKDGHGIKVSLETLCRLTKHNASFICKTLGWWVKSTYLIESNTVRKGSRITHEYRLNLDLISQNQEADISQKTIVQRTNVDTSTIVRRTNDNCSENKRQLSVEQLEQCLNNDLKNVTYAREEESAKIDEPVQKLPPKQIQEPKMSESDNPWIAKLTERGLTSRQIDEFLDMEKAHGGYIQTNISYFDNYIKKYPAKNNVAMLVTCLRADWGRHGEGPLQPPSAPASTYTPPSSPTILDFTSVEAKLERKRISDRRFARAQGATQEQRIRCMKIAEHLDPYCLLQFDNMPGLKRDDFVTFPHAAENEEGKPSLFKSCVTRLMDSVEQAEKASAREEQNTKFSL
jgi:hypothetical protein